MFNVLNLCFSTTTKKTIFVDFQMKVKKMMREEYLLKSCSRNRKRAKKEEECNGVIDIILDNDEHKEKLLLKNAKNVKNGQYYDKVIEELKERCSKREEVSPSTLDKPGSDQSLSIASISAEMQ